MKRLCMLRSSSHCWMSEIVKYRKIHCSECACACVCMCVRVCALHWWLLSTASRLFHRLAQSYTHTKVSHVRTHAAEKMKERCCIVQAERVRVLEKWNCGCVWFITGSSLRICRFFWAKFVSRYDVDVRVCCCNVLYTHTILSQKSVWDTHAGPLRMPAIFLHTHAQCTRIGRFAHSCMRQFSHVVRPKHADNE